jgi:hypothetical protein
MKIDLSQFAEKEEPDFIVALGLDEYARKTLSICPCRDGLDSAMDSLAEEAQKNGLLLRRDRHLVLKDKDGLMPYLVAELERNSYAVRTMKLKELGRKIRREMIQELNERLGVSGATDV